MIVEAIRLLITLALTAGGYLVGAQVLSPPAGIDPDTFPVVGALLGAGVGYVVGGVVGRAFRTGLDAAPARLSPRLSGPQLFAGAFGVVVGLLIGVVLDIPLVVFLPPVVAWPLAALVILLSTTLAGRMFAARSEDLLAVAGLRPRAPLVSRRLGAEEKSFLLDSSAAIDGRVLELARAGLVEGRVWVAAVVLDELQALADSADRKIRRRGRRGLDVLDALRGVGAVDVGVLDDSVPEFADVDAKLMALADRSASVLLTTDHNLAKAAELRGIQILNPQSLSESLKPQVVAGDRFVLPVSRAGSEPGQGVGFLDDGTMVVVADAAGLVGREIEIEVTGATRTSIGRMLFARPVS